MYGVAFDNWGNSQSAGDRMADSKLNHSVHTYQVIDIGGEHNPPTSRNARVIECKGYQRGMKDSIVDDVTGCSLEKQRVSKMTSGFD
ncbi:MAG: hypothetical protein Crog4KO_34780 [Crocinitomicaceae bacterium]